MMPIWWGSGTEPPTAIKVRKNTIKTVYGEVIYCRTIYEIKDETRNRISHYGNIILTLIRLTSFSDLRCLWNTKASFGVINNCLLLCFQYLLYIFTCFRRAKNVTFQLSIWFKTIFKLQHFWVKVYFYHLNYYSSSMDLPLIFNYSKSVLFNIPTCFY